MHSDNTYFSQAD